jgi:predicted amidohydrolase
VILNLVQYNPEWENKEVNKEKILRLVGKSLLPESVLIFPELTLTSFTMKSDVYAEDLKGETFEFFSRIASENNLHVLAGLIEKENGSFYNSLIYIDSSGEIKAKYRKIHPFSYSTEDKHYLRGEKPEISDISGWKTGLSICYDLRFPELYRQYGKERAELIIVIANWPDTRIEHWRVLLRARAIENQCYVAGVNRIGNDPKLHYNGFSGIYDPMGNEIASVADTEQVIAADISMEMVNETRNKFPFLEDIYLL